MNYAKALQKLYPNTTWVLDGDSYDGLMWLDENVEKPSKTELDAEVSRQSAEYIATEYQRRRQPEYPPIADLADALYWQAQGDESKMTAYLAAVEAVKQKYPKGV